MKKQQMEIRELQAKLQQQQERSVAVDVATQIVHEATPTGEISEATQQPAVTQCHPNTWHTPSKEEKTEERQKKVEEALRSLGRSPKEEHKNSRNKASRHRRRERDSASRVRQAEAETGVVPVARLFQLDFRRRIGSLRSQWSTLEGVRQGRPAASGCRTESRG